MGEQCMNKVTQSEAINKKKTQTRDKQKYWRRKIHKILSEEFNSRLDQAE